MNQQELILSIAKAELSESNKLGFIELPQTEAQVKRINEGVPIQATGLRTWSKRFKRSYDYLIVKAYAGTWREQLVKVAL